MEPGIALARLERALRQVMESCYSGALGPDWLNTVTKPEQITAWASRATVEAAKRTRRGVAGVPAAGLAYANLHDLRQILHAHWEPVAAALGPLREVAALLERFDNLTAEQAAKREVLALLDRFDDLRNTVAHSRELLPFEKDLLAGIAGDIGNRVTIHMSNQDPGGDYYPRIDSVRDAFGNEPTAEALATGTTPFVETGMRLRPGDVVTFTCQGTDPQGRQLDWGLQNGRVGMGGHDSFFVAQSSGSDVTLDWEVTDDDVRIRAQIFVVLRAAGTQFHREGWVDQQVVFAYRVDPADDRAQLIEPAEHAGLA